MESFMVDAGTLIERYSTVLTLVIGAIAVTGVLWRVVLRPILESVRELAEQMQALRVVAEAQLTGNGGTSLIDKVNRIEPNHTEVKNALKAAEAVETERWSSLDQRLKALEAKPPTVVIHNDPHMGATP